MQEALLGAVVRSARQTGQVKKNRDFLLSMGSSGRQIHVNLHLAIGGGSSMGQLQELAAEGRDGGFRLEGHGEGTECSSRKYWIVAEGEMSELGEVKSSRSEAAFFQSA